MGWCARLGIADSIFKAIIECVKDENLPECVGNAEQVEGRLKDDYGRKLTHSGRYVIIHFLCFYRKTYTWCAYIANSSATTKYLGAEPTYSNLDNKDAAPRVNRDHWISKDQHI